MIRAGTLRLPISQLEERRRGADTSMVRRRSTPGAGVAAIRIGDPGPC